MPVESAADRAVFVNPDEFGATASWSVDGAAGVAVAGVFDEPAGDALADPGIEAAQPSFACRSADVPAAATFGDNTPDRLTIGGRVFLPLRQGDDGTGMSRIILEEEET